MRAARNEAVSPRRKADFKRKGGLQAVYEDGAEKGKKEKIDSNFLNQDHTTF